MSQSDGRSKPVAAHSSKNTLKFVRSFHPRTDLIEQKLMKYVKQCDETSQNVLLKNYIESEADSESDDEEQSSEVILPLPLKADKAPSLDMAAIQGTELLLRQRRHFFDGTLESTEAAALQKDIQRFMPSDKLKSEPSTNNTTIQLHEGCQDVGNTPRSMMSTVHRKIFKNMRSDSPVSEKGKGKSRSIKSEYISVDDDVQRVEMTNFNHTRSNTMKLQKTKKKKEETLTRIKNINQDSELDLSIQSLKARLEELTKSKITTRLPSVPHLKLKTLFLTKTTPKLKSSFPLVKFNLHKKRPVTFPLIQVNNKLKKNLKTKDLEDTTMTTTTKKLEFLSGLSHEELSTDSNHSNFEIHHKNFRMKGQGLEVPWKYPMANRVLRGIDLSLDVVAATQALVDSNTYTDEPKTTNSSHGPQVSYQVTSGGLVEPKEIPTIEKSLVPKTRPNRFSGGGGNKPIVRNYPRQLEIGARYIGRSKGISKITTKTKSLDLDILNKSNENVKFGLTVANLEIHNRFLPIDKTLQRKNLLEQKTNYFVGQSNDRHVMNPISNQFVEKKSKRKNIRNGVVKLTPSPYEHKTGHFGGLKIYPTSGRRPRRPYKNVLLSKPSNNIKSNYNTDGFLPVKMSAYAMRIHDKMNQIIGDGINPTDKIYLKDRRYLDLIDILEPCVASSKFIPRNELETLGGTDDQNEEFFLNMN